MALSGLFARLRKNEYDADAGASDITVQPTRALARFLAGLNTCQQSVLLDLGPAVGSNVTFFCEELGCKILVDDLLGDVDRHISHAKVNELPAFFDKRFPQQSETVDGVLCWDIFDYLERAAAERLARQLTRVLRPGGVLLAFFSTTDPRSTTRPAYTRHVVIDRTRLQYQLYTAACAKQRPLLNRDIQRLFEPLRVSESFLLKAHLREVLFCKATDTATAPFGASLAEH